MGAPKEQQNQSGDEIYRYIIGRPKPSPGELMADVVEQHVPASSAMAASSFKDTVSAAQRASFDLFK